MAVIFLIAFFGVILWSIFTSKKISKKPQLTKPRNEYKRIPIAPPKRGMSDITASALQVRKQNQKQGEAEYFPLVEETFISEDEYFEFANHKTWGQIQAELLPETLVDGKQTWELISGEEKHDLRKMLECCLAELERMRGTGQVPAPAYFERVAILMRKEKNYEKEIEIIEFYWRSLDEIYQKNQRIGSSYIKALKERFRHRYDKAKILLQKQKNSAKSANDLC